MIFPKAVVRKFLNRPLDDWRWYKSLTAKELDERCDRLPVDPPGWDGLLLHQKQGVLLGIRLKRMYFIYDTGSGKTRMAITLARYFNRKGTLRACLVLVPAKVNKAEWGRELRKHAPKFPYIILEGSSERKLQQIADNPDTAVFIETYAGLMRMLAPLKSVKPKKGKKQTRKRKLTRDDKRVKALLKLVNMMVFDEASEAIGSVDSATYRMMKRLSWACDYAYSLDGTPFGRDPTPLWSHMHVIDRGETLGETLGLFRAAFYSQVPNDFGFDWEFKKSMRKDLHRVLRHRSLRYKVDEADLPSLVSIVKRVDLSETAAAIYAKALDSLRASRGKKIESKNEFLRMRQVAGGFLGYSDDDTGKRAQVEFQDNPKLELLLSLLRQTAQQHKVVVAHEFTFSGSMICREIDAQLGLPYARIYGGTRDPEAELLRFVEDPDCRVLVLNNHAGALGLNLQVAKYLMVYESPTCPKRRKQLIARIYRQGSQFGKVLVYDLLACAIEWKILDFHREGRDLWEAILDGKEVV